MNNVIEYCCSEFLSAVKNEFLTCTKEDEWSREIEVLDGWYICKRAYDSWWGYFPVGKKWVSCPWCGEPAPSIYVLESIRAKLEDQKKNRTVYAKGVIKYE